MDRLGVKPGECVRLTSREGSVVVRAARGRPGAHPGIVFLPYGPYASLLMGTETGGTGMPHLKGIPVEVEPAPGERVLGVDELLKAVYGGG
jgi:formylmethanofuran dehydrogenase subunit D